MTSASVGVADDVVPVLEGKLGGDKHGSAFVSVFDDLEEVSSFLVRQVGRAPVVEDEEVSFGQGVHHPGIAAVALGACEVLEEPVRAVVEHTESMIAINRNR